MQPNLVANEIASSVIEPHNAISLYNIGFFCV